MSARIMVEAARETVSVMYGSEALELGQPYPDYGSDRCSSDASHNLKGTEQ